MQLVALDAAVRIVRILMALHNCLRAGRTSRCSVSLLAPQSLQPRSLVERRSPSKNSRTTPGRFK